VTLGGFGVDEFNSIAEGIMDEGTFDARLRSIPVDLDSIRGELVEEKLVASDSKGWVRLAGGRKRLLYTEVKLKIPALEPNAAARGGILRLGQFFQAQKRPVEAASGCLLVFWHSYLNMVQTDDMHHDVLR